MHSEELSQKYAEEIQKISYKELDELKKAQNQKQELLQNFRAAREEKLIETANEIIDKEAIDILQILETIPEQYKEEVLLLALQNFSKKNKLPISHNCLAAKIQILQYLSPQFKKKVGSEIENFLGLNSQKTDCSDPLLALANPANPTQDDDIKIIKILEQEGFNAQLRYFIVDHDSLKRTKKYSEYQAVTENYLKTEVGKCQQELQKMIKHIKNPQNKKTSLELYINSIIEKINPAESEELEHNDPYYTYKSWRLKILEKTKGKAKNQFEKLLPADPENSDNIHLAFLLFINYKNFENLQEMDCDERSLTSLNITANNDQTTLNFTLIKAHAVLTFNGITPAIVLDPYDNCFKQRDEMAKFFNSTNIRDSHGKYYLAILEPTKYKEIDQIKDYQEIQDKNHPIQEHENIGNLIGQEAIDSAKKAFKHQKRKLLFLQLIKKHSHSGLSENISIQIAIDQYNEISNKSKQSKKEYGQIYYQKNKNLETYIQELDKKIKKAESEAIILGEFAKNVSQNSAIMHSTLGYIYSVANKPKKAIKNYELSLELNPHDLETYKEFSNYLISIKNYKKAGTTLTRALPLLNPKSNTYKTWLEKSKFLTQGQPAEKIELKILYDKN